MKGIFCTALAACLLAGCASTENGRVQTSADGTHYGLNDQPESIVAGEGTLMPGAYDPRHLPTGQFTGQERTQDVIGQRPTLPRETDARQMDRSGTPQFGTGAGSLGQAGVVNGQPSLSGSTLAETPLNPATQPSASDIYRPSAAPGHSNVAPPSSGSVGSAPSVESSANSATNNPTIPSRVDEK